MKRLESILLFVLLIMGNIVYFTAYFNGINDWNVHQHISFINVSGLSLGLFLMCLFLGLRVVSLSRQMDDFKKKI